MKHIIRLLILAILILSFWLVLVFYVIYPPRQSCMINLVVRAFEGQSKESGRQNTNEALGMRPGETLFKERKRGNGVVTLCKNGQKRK